MLTVFWLTKTDQISSAASRLDFG